MISSFVPSAIARSVLLSLVAAMVFVPAGFAAETKTATQPQRQGLLHRVNKMEECLYGAAHKEKPLDLRISELEAQTLGGGQHGPLAKRLENIEKLVNGQTHGTAVIPPPSVAPPIAPPIEAKRQEKKQETTPTADINDMLKKGTAAHSAGQSEEAEKIFKDVLVKSPFNSNAMFNLGAIAESKGDLTTALGNYRTALIGAPDDPQIQQAIAQVEAQIAQQQSSPFKTPVLSTADGGTLLKGNATEFDPLAAQRSSTQNQLNGNAVQASGSGQAQTPAPRGSAWRTVGAAGGALVGSFARGALQGAIRGGGSGAFSGAISAGSRGAVGSLLRAGGLGALHCPICRILP